MKEKEFCEEHKTSKVWVHCTNCEYGFSGHDCGEDCCCCLNPEDNIVCDICKGKEGYYLCPVCTEDAFREYDFI